MSVNTNSPHAPFFMCQTIYLATNAYWGRWAYLLIILLKFRKWFMYGLKVQKLLAQSNGYKQPALKAQKLLAQGNGYKQHALKGQKLLAQGNALGCLGR